MDLDQLVMVREDRLKDCVSKVGGNITMSDREVVKPDRPVVAPQGRVGARSDHRSSKLGHGETQIEDLLRGKWNVTDLSLFFEINKRRKWNARGHCEGIESSSLHLVR